MMDAFDFKDFIKPQKKYKTRPLWFWNSRNRTLSGITKEGIREIMLHSAENSGYAGFGILPEWLDGYMSDAYLALYEAALETADNLDLKMCLYDENGFPSGSAGGLLAKLYPNDTMKRLDLEEKDVSGPCEAEYSVAFGGDAKYIGAVLFEQHTKEIADVSGQFLPDACGRYCAALRIPAGSWKVMIFCVRKDGYDRVDYLNKNAVAHLMEITHERYYRHFQKYFGNVIDSAFYDEPMLYQAKGRTWTEEFNTLFEKKYGFDPITLYPALWYDIGEKTAFARNALFGFRTELFSENYIKTMNDWCADHGIALTGHMDQEENVNPVTTCGDLMKIFEYQDIPGIDEISWYDRAVKAYKIVSSSAYNWDKPLVMTEVYGAMGEEIGTEALYKDIMNQFVRGINYVVPHAVWYQAEEGVTFPPELSYRNRKYAAALPAYNDFTARVSMLLRGGRHVADIALLYPIDFLKAETRFDCGDPYYGVAPEGADYMELGHVLFTELRRDFTFLHPETVLEKCSAADGRFLLNNKINFESYRVVILPGGSTVSFAVMQKIKEFYQCGGKIIFTSLLPSRSTEAGMDTGVQQIVAELLNPKDPHAAGKAVWIPSGRSEDLGPVLDEFLKVPDVAIECAEALSGGSLGYIHKIKNGRNIYYFANSSDQDISCAVTIRGKISEPWFWDPHKGSRSRAACSYKEIDGEAVTRFPLHLRSVESLFMMENGY